MIDLDLIIEKTKAQLRKDEGGFHASPYRDQVGKLTIGYGWNLDDSLMRLAEAEFRLNNDANEKLVELIKSIPWFGQLNTVRQSALLNMAYNMGARALLRWVNTLEMLSRGDYAGAAQSIRSSKYYTQVGDRAERIANMIETGEWPEEA
jgi:lysozyme